MASPADSRFTLTIGALIIASLGVGWFVLSHVVMKTDIPDAVGESVGVVLALAVVASIAGSVLQGRGKPG